MRLATVFPILLCLTALPARAQEIAAEPVTTTPDEAIEQASEVYGPPQPRNRSCGHTDKNGDIVVCAPDNDEFRVQSSRELDPDSHEATYDGLPRAPQLDRGSCRGQPGCVAVGSVPPPVYYIDVTALPQAPAGSEAEEVAKGERAER